MADTQSQVPGAPPGAHQRHDHERSEIQVGGIFVFGVILTVFTLVWMAILYVVVRSYYVGRQDRAESNRPARFADISEQFPGARLQGNPAADLARLRVEDQRALNSYGWDSKAGIGRIPIDRALDIVARKGLPTRSAPEEPPSPGSPTPLPFAR
jgi:hypothetical protein